MFWIALATYCSVEACDFKDCISPIWISSLTLMYSNWVYKGLIHFIEKRLSQRHWKECLWSWRLYLMYSTQQNKDRDAYNSLIKSRRMLMNEDSLYKHTAKSSDGCFIEGRMNQSIKCTALVSRLPTMWAHPSSLLCQMKGSNKKRWKKRLYLFECHNTHQLSNTGDISVTEAQQREQSVCLSNERERDTISVNALYLCLCFCFIHRIYFVELFHFNKKHNLTISPVG